MKMPTGLEGFEHYKASSDKRILIASEGLDKTGKTDWALDAPYVLSDGSSGIVAIFNFDIGLEGVIEKKMAASPKKHYIIHTVSIPPASTAAMYCAIFEKFKTAYLKSLEHPLVRSIILDTGSDFWVLMRMAEFGKLSPAVDIKKAYDPLNQLYKSLIRAAYDSQKTLIITHKVKPLYVKVGNDDKGRPVTEWDGVTYKRDGFNQTAYLIQLNIRHFFEDGQFGVEIMNSRHDMGLSGFKLYGDDCRFNNVVSTVTGTNPSDWT